MINTVLTNDKNFLFYENIGVDTFKDLAEKGGFSTYHDLELAFPFIKSADSILEIGAGYGRCIDYLRKKGYKGKLIAVEQSTALVNHLKDRFSDVNIMHGDIKKLELSQKVDSALWMWSGILDFSPEEQLLCLKRIAGLLTVKGNLAIDVPSLGHKTIASHLDEQNLHFETPFGTLDCYIPSREEMEKMTKQAGFATLEEINYKTATGMPRTMYILEK